MRTICVIVGLSMILTANATQQGWLVAVGSVLFGAALIVK